MAKHSFDLKAWALVGAQKRLRELDEERNRILTAFPQLRSGASGRLREDSDTNVATPADRPVRRRRFRMSAEARKRISAAQKARWAKQRAGAKKATSR